MSTPIRRFTYLAVATFGICNPVCANPRIIMAPRVIAAPPAPVSHSTGGLGGGFVEYLFTANSGQGPVYAPPPEQSYSPGYGGWRGDGPRPSYGGKRSSRVEATPEGLRLPPNDPRMQRPRVSAPSPASNAMYVAPMRPEVADMFRRQSVAYDGKQKAGTVIVDTSNRFLYLVQADGKALRYGIGVGREGFQWRGSHPITAKKEWPDWRPPSEMLERQPHLPRFMPGGPRNPLGARAMYLGSTLYRIHGSNEPWTIGQAVSSGCIRMTNDDVTDLYSRVKTGTKVVVL
jgi:lipoprotein-anchoring transpeptidase ErfK/SrfK